MTPDIAKLLGIVLVAMVLFALEPAPADVIALGVLLAVVLLGLLTPDEAFAGFGSRTVLMILGLLILTAALLRTGVVDMVGSAIIKRSGNDPKRLLLIIMLATAFLSAFISNTAATAFFLPIVFGVATRAGQSPSKFLMPLAFASILTSSVTLVSTSTNLVVSDLMVRYGLPAMGMFELARVGIPVAAVGIAYMWFLGRHLVPERNAGAEGLDDYGLQAYLTEVMILPGSPLAGKTLEESGLGRDLDLTVIRIIREQDKYLWPTASSRLEEGDVLLVEGPREEILKVKDRAGIDIKADVKLSDPDLQKGEAALVEAVLLPRSRLIGRTLKGFRFRERYGLQVLGLNRHGGSIWTKISQVPLRRGDVLLIQGRREHVKELAASGTIRVLGAVEDTRPNVRRAWVAIAAFVGALALATLNIVALPVAVLLGAFAVFVTRTITPEEAYNTIEWKVLILIGCMLALGAAMEKTGADKYLAGLIVQTAGQAGPTALLAGFFLLTVVLTQPMSNQAAAVVVLPVALRTAMDLGLEPRSFAMMVAVAASCSYLTPLEPSCLMVYGPGRYRFLDFLKVGGILTLLILLVAMALVPMGWPVAR